MANQGHIRQRGKQSWELRYRANSKTLTETVHGTKAKARARLTEIIDQINKGQFATCGDMSLGQWLERWLHFMSEEKASYSADKYKWMCEAYIVPAIGTVRLDRLTPAVVSHFYSSVRGKTKKTLGAQTRRQLHACLSGALERAVELNLIPNNPARKCRKQLPRLDKKEMVVLTVEQSRQLLDVAYGSQLYPAILIALATGARRGECLGLRWRSVDLDKGIVRITEQLEERRGQEVTVKAPKGEKVRAINLAPVHVEMFRRLKIEQAEHLLRFGVRQTGDHLVCALPDGSEPSPSALSWTFPRFVRRIPGMPAISFHDLRHSHATIGLQFGIPAKVMQERLGHSSIRLTMDLYSHVTETMQEQAAAKLDEAFR